MGSNLKKDHSQLETEELKRDLRLVNSDSQVEHAHPSDSKTLPKTLKKSPLSHLELVTTRSLLYCLKIKNNYTYEHSLRVASYSLLIAQELGFTPTQLTRLELAATLHDIGKLGTPDYVLNKPQRLEHEEFLIMKKHPQESAKIIDKFPFYQDIIKPVLHHHERMDGRGYPSKLKGAQIPLFSRIIIIADTYDAMTSNRVYRDGLDINIAIQEIKDCSPSQFDPELAKIFINKITDYKLETNQLFNLDTEISRDKLNELRENSENESSDENQTQSEVAKKSA